MASDAREQSTTPAYASRENLLSEALASSVPRIHPYDEASIFSKLTAVFHAASPKACDNYAETNQRVGWECCVRCSPWDSVMRITIGSSPGRRFRVHFVRR
jgi:hypothetical protein